MGKTLRHFHDVLYRFENMTFSKITVVLFIILQLSSCLSFTLVSINVSPLSSSPHLPHIWIMNGCRKKYTQRWAKFANKRTYNVEKKATMIYHPSCSRSPKTWRNGGMILTPMHL